ncbi:MAG: DUF4446 family protein [Lachnospiraceae bacterium]|nr:DUF4446 family protein [Lachnospiraceae bacterium]
MAVQSGTSPAGVSNLLNSIGLGGLDIAWFLLVILILMLVFIVLLLIEHKKYRALKQRYEKFMGGRDALSLEEKTQELIRDVERLKKESRAYANDIDLLFSKHESAIQKVGLYRYDAFREMGGKLSFCLVLLDEKDNGVLLDSVYSTNGCYAYTKQITQGKSDVDMSEEEKKALKQVLEKYS